MSKLISIFCLIVITISSYCQTGYFINTFNPAGQNPGNLNTDTEEPWSFVPGHTTLIPINITNVSWSPIQTIPFNFNFNGSAVTSYKVSNSGVLTFNTSTTKLPSNLNNTLPHPSIPDNSVMVWGLQQSFGDAVVSKTYGTAPNRQHWVKFLSFSAPGAIGQHWTYWSIVLEESSNKIYIVDERTYNIALVLTIGVQIDSTTAYQLASSPSTSSFITRGFNINDSRDNVYYEFNPGSRLNNDSKLLDLKLDQTETSPVKISGTLKNDGINTLNSIVINWSVVGSTIVNSDTITTNISTEDTLLFSSTSNWVPSIVGQVYDIEVWTSLPNGVIDQNTSNDTLVSKVLIVNGNTVQKNVLIEQFTTAECSMCPDGAWIIQQILNNYQNVYSSSVHSCFRSDSMTNRAALDLCNPIVIKSAPAAMIDRKIFPREKDLSFGRGVMGYPAWANSIWSSRALSQTTLGSPVDINIYGTYNPTNRNLNATVDASFVDYILSGDIRVSLMLIEDSVRGFGSGYDQANALNTMQNGHPFANRGNPIVGYYHRRVLREILPSSWGDSTVIPTNISLNTSYNSSYTITIPSAYDDSQMYLLATVNYYGGANIDDYEVLNAKRIRLNLITSIDEVKDELNSFNIYPNPTNLPFTNVEFKLNEKSRIEATVYDLTGKKVGFQDFGEMSAGNQRIQIETAKLKNGFYMVNFKVGDQQLTRKISILK